MCISLALFEGQCALVFVRRLLQYNKPNFDENNNNIKETKRRSLKNNKISKENILSVYLDLSHIEEKPSFIYSCNKKEYTSKDTRIRIEITEYRQGQWKS